MGQARSSDTARRALRASVRAVDDLTPGQRWTLGLMAGLALLVVAFGLPPAAPLASPIAADAAAAAPSVDPTTGSLAGSVGGTPAGSAAPTPSTGPARSTTGGAGAVPQAIGGDAPAGPSALPPDDGPFDGAGTVVALVDTEAAGPRGDEAMARHFLDDAGLDAGLVPMGDAFDTCQAVGGAAVVVAAQTVPPPLRACLDARGVRTVSWDDALDLDARLVLRRGAARSLVDTATGLADELDGEVALVADDRLRAVLEPVLGDAAEAGLTIDRSVWLEEDADLAGVGVDLAGAGTEVVVFATAVRRQSTLASQLRLLSPGVRFVVLDVADSVVDARYPLAMDGAAAVTSVQFPWHPGAEDLRARCRRSWEQAQLPPLVLGNDELLRALLWCQNVALAADLAAGDVPDGAPVLQTRRRSAITSALDVLVDGGYGPARVTHATWSAGCGCWSAESGFREAGGRRP